MASWMVKVKIIFFSLGFWDTLFQTNPDINQNTWWVLQLSTTNSQQKNGTSGYGWIESIPNSPKLAMLFTSQDHDHAENHLIPEGWCRGSIRRCFHLRCKHVLTTCLSAIGLSVYIWTGCKHADFSSCFSLYPDIFSGKKKRGISNSGLEYRY